MQSYDIYEIKCKLWKKDLVRRSGNVQEHRIIGVDGACVIRSF